MLYDGTAALWRVRRDLKVGLRADVVGVPGVVACLVSRGTQIPYPTAVSLVEGLGVSPVVSEHQVVYLSNSESVEGPAVQGLELGASIEEDSSEPETNPEMLVELEKVALANAKGMGTFVAGGSLLAVSPIGGYCLLHE
ncbi:hypothetical protein M9H77_22710 [Catharanthus roseus]|uniref:Uncharacterized protein n=1 Tax=Catharanthus roseus TaxID=4058 RepID=A0ACC0AQV0_CATRO|nr:hypothetical protein M9H77_22710 [Catharanthus roseus]